MGVGESLSVSISHSNSRCVWSPFLCRLSASVVLAFVTDHSPVSQVCGWTLWPGHCSKCADDSGCPVRKARPWTHVPSVLPCSGPVLRPTPGGRCRYVANEETQLSDLTASCAAEDREETRAFKSELGVEPALPRAGGQPASVWASLGHSLTRSWCRVGSERRKRERQ